MSDTLKIISPIDQSIVAERPVATAQQINTVLTNAQQAQRQWQQISISERARLCHQAIDEFVAQADEISKEITLQMGRPLQHTPGEVAGVEERARYMIDIAEQELMDIPVEERPGFQRFIRQQALGVVLCIVPWNYPYLTAINAIIPALMSGNSVILKHSTQTLLCAERLFQVFEKVGLPAGVFQYLHLNHALTTALVQNTAIAYVTFTGSNAGGITIEQALAGHFKPVTFELGGKDPAYVLPDADLAFAVANLVDGAFFNSGQSCCAIERIYVHENVYDAFVEQFVHLVKQYRVGNPFDENTSLGPVVSKKRAEFIRAQIKQAESLGATACINEGDFAVAGLSETFLAPQVLLNVDHSMAVMKEETFGPVIGIMKVRNDQEAVQLMNDSRYGLTASFWTQDTDKAILLGDQINTGTVFMNRCDYLDPALAWIGVKQSGRGCSLSRLAYKHFTRPKSFHLRKL